MPRGGYQAPAHPAAVSGPGALSQRTDGPMTMQGGSYGDTTALNAVQHGAPMASAPAPSGGAPQGAPSPVVPLDAPTQQPGTPVTDGAALGAGAGPEALGWQQQATAKSVAIAHEVLPLLVQRAGDPDTGWQVRSLVSYLQGIATPGARPDA